MIIILSSYFVKLFRKKCFYGESNDKKIKTNESKSTRPVTLVGILDYVIRIAYVVLYSMFMRPWSQIHEGYFYV